MKEDEKKMQTFEIKKEGIKLIKENLESLKPLTYLDPNIKFPPRDFNKDCNELVKFQEGLLFAHSKINKCDIKNEKTKEC